MKIIVIIITVLFSISVTAQKKQKIKGDGEVVEVFKDLDTFSQIEISDDLEVSIMQKGEDGYRLKTDSNLLDVIELDVINDVLKIYTSRKVVSNKKLEIYVTFQTLNKITLRDKSELIGKNNIQSDSLTLNSFDNSSFDLDINASHVVAEMNNNSSGKLILKSDNSTITLNDKSTLKGNLSIVDFALNVNKNSDLNIEGNSENLNIITNGSSNIKAKKFMANNAQLNTSDTADTHLYVTNLLSIYATGKSFIYVYGPPKLRLKA